jgi:eukaryotic-like serine/threonine-protein kinase
MADDRWLRVKRLFEVAVEQPPAERSAFVLAAVDGDDTLRAEVRALLDADAATAEISHRWPAASQSLLAELRLGLPPDPGEATFVVGEHVGPYRILALLGSGGMGHVFRAHDSKLNRDVALKVLPRAYEVDPDRMARFQREAQALAALNHPHVAAIYGIEESHGRTALVLELVDGVTLAARIGQGPLPVRKALTLARHIAEALQAAHEKGIVHRDLKPANIKVTPAGVVKVLDFGLAKAAGDSTPTAPSESPALPGDTRAGVIVGTASYMSPEQARGKGVDPRTDIWAFGCVLFEMLAGRRAFEGDGAPDSLANVEDADPEWARLPTHTPARVRQLLRRCLEKDPRKRPQTIGEARAVIDGLLARRVGRGAAAAVAALAAIVVAVVVYGTIPRAPATAASPPPVVLAVLPFANHSGDAEQDYLSAGLTDEIASELARIQPDRLRVIPRATTTRYHQSRRGASRIGADLGANYVIEGTTARTGERIDIRVRLVRGGDLTEVWSEHYERHKEEVPIVEADVARSIAREVSLILRPEQRARLDRRAAIDPDAYEKYLRGRFFLEKRTGQGLKRAVEEFRAATERYPEYAAAHAGIAGAYILLSYYAHLPPDQAYAGARAASATAVKLDDQLAEAHVMLAGVYNEYDLQWRTAETEYREALRLDPNYSTAHQWYANLLIGMGRRDEAQSHILRARELDPLSLIIQVNVANIFLLSRDYDRARQECRKAIEMDENFVTARWILGRAEQLLGRYDAAVAEFEHGLKLEPDNTVLRAALARAHAAAGATARARQMMAGLERTNTRRYVSPLDLASVHAALNQPDQAFTLLARAVRERANRIVFLNVDPAYDALRGDPRFDQLLRTVNLN